MNTKFDPKMHQRKSIRLKGFDYSQPGGYYVTIVTYRRESLFGEVWSGVMQLNPLGKIVQEEWFRSAKIRKEIRLIEDEFVVMPNHLHGIVWIDTTVGADGLRPNPKTGANDMGAYHAPLHRKLKYVPVTFKVTGTSPAYPFRLFNYQPIRLLNFPIFVPQPPPLFAKTTPKTPKTTPFLRQSILPSRPFRAALAYFLPSPLHKTPKTTPNSARNRSSLSYCSLISTLCSLFHFLFLVVFN